MDQGACLASAQNPSRPSGFRLQAPAALTPAKRLNLTHATRTNRGENLVGTEVLTGFHAHPFGLSSSWNGG